MDTKNLDIVDVGCFGYESPKKDCWLEMLKGAATCREVTDFPKFEKSFSGNVEASYYRMCGIIVKDLDTDFEYFVSFINGKKKWDAEIVDSKDAEVLPEEKKTLFSNELVKKAIKQAYAYVMQAKDAYTEKVEASLKEGDITAVDELKLEEVLRFINDNAFMDSFKKGTYMS